MFLPEPTVVVSMSAETEEGGGGELRLNPQVVSAAKTSLQIQWEGADAPFVSGFRVRYQKISSSYAQDSGLLGAATQNYNIGNLVADTYYKVCVAVYQNASRQPQATECVEADTSGYGVPVSVGSSLGALLTLCIIVVIVLLARCPALVKRPRGCRTAAADSSKYDSMSFHGVIGEVEEGGRASGEGRGEASNGPTPPFCRQAARAARGDGGEEGDDDFSQISQGTMDSLTGSTPKHHSHSHHHHHHQQQQSTNHTPPQKEYQHQYQQRQQQHKVPLSLAERLYNGGSSTPRGRASGGGGRAPSLAKCGRAVSLTDGRHPVASNHIQQYRTRQARLAKMHSQFQSIQSEPGPTTGMPRVRSSDFPASTSSHSSELLSPRRELACGSDCPYRIRGSAGGSKSSLQHYHGSCSPKASSAKSTPRAVNRLETMTSCSEPSVAAADTKRSRAPELHKISKTIHLSMEADTMV